MNVLSFGERLRATLLVLVAMPTGLTLGVLLLWGYAEWS